MAHDPHMRRLRAAERALEALRAGGDPNDMDAIYVLRSNALQAIDAAGMKASTVDRLDVAEAAHALWMAVPAAFEAGQNARVAARDAAIAALDARRYGKTESEREREALRRGAPYSPSKI